MSNFFSQFVNQLGTGDNIKDYQHAQRTFIDGLYRLSPKQKFLFHVFVDLNPNVAQLDQNQQIEIGLMAKSAQLPKFTVQNKVLNAYNRKNIVQERIQYDPVIITFHDDSADVVREFWYNYYSYYYRDSDHVETMYHAPHKYAERQQQSWGYSPLSTKDTHYINSIRIYSLHQKSFSSYILINPTITAFQHGDHAYEDGAGIMEHSMTLQYEAVQYETGPVSNGTVLGWNVIHYDNSPSPLSPIGGGTRSILGPGGLVQSAGDVITNLNNGNFLGAGLIGLRSYNNFKNSNLKQVAGQELLQVGRNILRGQNPLSTVYFPTAGSITEGISKASNPSGEKLGTPSNQGDT